VVVVGVNKHPPLCFLGVGEIIFVFWEWEVLYYNYETQAQIYNRGDPPEGYSYREAIR
jgi:hypothetical protein